MLRCANSEFALGGFGKLANSYAGHAINDSTEIIDCNRELNQKRPSKNTDIEEI